MKRNQQVDRPVPPGQGRKVVWKPARQVFDKPTAEQSWLWDAMHHWGAQHGDPATECQPTLKQVSKWTAQQSTGGASAWLNGDKLASLDWFLAVKEGVGCSKETCDSPYADKSALIDHYRKQLQREDAVRHEAKAASAVHAPRQPRRTVGAAPQNLLPNREAADTLRRVSTRTIRTWEAVVPSSTAPDKATVRLGDLYVRRRHQQDQITKQVDDQRGNPSHQGAAVLGEPGTGKSCFLWGLRSELAQKKYEVVAISAAALLSPGGREPEITERTLFGGLLHIRRETSAQGRHMVFFLDTADLLLHRDNGPKTLANMIKRVRKCDIPLVMACRTIEARLLEDHCESTTDTLLYKIKLGDFDDGNGNTTAGRRMAGWAPDSELDQAVDAYLRVFYRAPGDPAPDEKGGQVSLIHHELAEHMRATLADAAARGLPLGRLIRHPLSLRMVFDLYAPQGPRHNDLDVAELFNEYWHHRVFHDKRQALIGTGTGRSEVDAHRDLTREAQLLGLQMLREGSPEIPYKTAVRVLTAHGNPNQDQNVRSLAILLNRGVLRKQERGHIAFHHQAFAEHAAGRGLLSQPRGLPQAVDRIIDQPEDLYLAEVLRHAFHVADREDTVPWHAHFVRLLKSTDKPAVILTGLRIHAGLRHPSVKIVNQAVSCLRQADVWQKISYLAALTGACHPSTSAWPPALREIWDYGDRQDRQRVLTAVTHLAHQQPCEVRGFVQKIDLLRFSSPQALDELPVGNDLTLLLLGLNSVDKERTAIACRRLFDAAIEYSAKPVLQHALLALERLLEEAEETYHPVAAGLPDLFGPLTVKRFWKNHLDDLIVLSAPTWSATIRGATLRQLRKLADDCLEALLGHTEHAAGEYLKLRGMALVLQTRGRQTIHQILNLSAGYCLEPAVTANVAKYLLAPLLKGGQFHPGSKAAVQWCRSHLRPGPGTDPEYGRTGMIAKALDTDKVPLPAKVVAACIGLVGKDDATPNDATLRRWLNAPWPSSLTVAAAAGGHKQAQLALQKHVEAGIGADVQAAEKLRWAIAQRAVTHPHSLLSLLIKDARKSGDKSGLKNLANMGPETLEPLLSRPEHAAAVAEIADILKGSEIKDAGLRLELRAASHLADRPDSVAETCGKLGSTNQPTVQALVLEQVADQLSRTPDMWHDEEPLEQLDPILRRLQDRGREYRDRPADDQTDQHIRAGNNAYLLRIALRAHYGSLSPEHRASTMAEVTDMAFAELTLQLPQRKVELSAWRSRIEILPRLCVRLAEEGDDAAARDLLEQALHHVNAVAGGEARWRRVLAKKWRPYLKIIGITDRDTLGRTVLTMAQKDVNMAALLVEVTAQSLGDISTTLYALIHDPKTPSRLIPALTKTAFWAGRSGYGMEWPELFGDVGELCNRYT